LLDARLGSAAVISKFGVSWLLDTTRRCKLYDWDNHQWLAFDGKATTGPLRISQHAGGRDVARALAQSRLAR